MAFSQKFLQIVLVSSLLYLSLAAARPLTESSEADSTMEFKYHMGPLLTGNVSINLIWYGNFKPAQRAIVSDFITSLLSHKPETQPSVATWWTAIRRYYILAHTKERQRPSSLSLSLGGQILDGKYSLGKSLTAKQLLSLAGKGGKANSVNVVLTAADVAVEGFCVSKCGTHGSISDPRNGAPRFTYIWVGNSETQCPGQCAWPFHQPIYGPQSPPLIAPNHDMGLDGMVINLAGLLAGTVTNPFGTGYYQGPSESPLEAASACSGVYGRGAYPGYAGNLLVDPRSGASYNANGVNGRKYLLPALFDPSKSSCSTLL
ncbi:Protein PHOSPHATE-INDUCED 1 [Ancistrocladus abbreviatus]